MPGNHNKGNGDWRRLLRRLAEVCAEDRKRWRANNQNIQAILAAIRQQGETLRQQGETLRQQGEAILKHEGHIEVLLKELHHRKEGQP